MGKAMIETAHDPSDTRIVELIWQVLRSDQGRHFISEIATEAIFRGGLGQRTDSLDIDRIAWIVAAVSSGAYAQARMPQAERFENAYCLMDAALKRAGREGLYLEFGVFSGRTINWISNAVPEATIFGFDSFAGLPETWRPGFEKGSFALADFPTLPANVELVTGWFDRTLPVFLERFPTKHVSFLHVDCDLYSSAQIVFAQLKTRIVPGTIIVFDEYFNYPGWEGHEHRAFQEFVQSAGLRYKYLGLVPHHQQVYVKIVE